MRRRARARSVPPAIAVTAVPHRRPAATERASSGRPRKRFPRAARLLRHADFQRVYHDGRRHFAAHMTVFYLFRTDSAAPRVGFTVGRALGGAVVRNRMKRRLREAVRNHLAALAVPVDVVINPKKSLLQADFPVLLGEVAGAFEKIGRQSPVAGRQQEEER